MTQKEKNCIDKEVMREFARTVEPFFFTTTTQIQKIVQTINIIYNWEAVDVGVVLFKIKMAQAYKATGTMPTYKDLREMGIGCNLSEDRIKNIIYREKYPDRIQEVVSWIETIDTAHK